MKTELLMAQSNLDAAQMESSTLVRQLHTLQMELYNAANTANGETNTDSESIKDKLVRNAVSSFVCLIVIHVR